MGVGTAAAVSGATFGAGITVLFSLNGRTLPKTLVTLSGTVVVF